MSAPFLNAATTQNTYTDALTVEFPHGRQSFSLNVHNNAIYYRLAIRPPIGQRGVDWEPGEHFLAPSLNNFESPEGEGFPPDTLFAGIAIRSASAGIPAVVSVA